MSTQGFVAAPAARGEGLQSQWLRIRAIIDQYAASTDPMNKRDQAAFMDMVDNFLALVRESPVAPMVDDNLEKFRAKYTVIRDLLINERKKYGIE